MMKKRSKLRSAVLPLFLMTAAAIVSCEEKIYFGNVDCSECFQQKPDSSYLYIDLTTLSGDYRGVPLVIYRGNIEEEQIERIDTAYGNRYFHWVSVDREYSVKAEYFINNVFIYVVDGTRIEIRKAIDACNVDECYVVVNTFLDARLNERYP